MNDYVFITHQAPLDIRTENTELKRIVLLLLESSIHPSYSLYFEVILDAV